MGIRRIRGFGFYGPSDEGAEVWLPTNGTTQGMPLVLVEHGTASGGIFYSGASERIGKMNYLCNHGFVVVSADYDFDPDPNVLSVRGSWGTDESLAGNLSVLDWVAADFGVNTDWFAIWADSAGAGTGLGMLWRHPDRVAAVQIHQGAVDQVAVRALGNSLINSLMDTAFHNNWAGLAPTHDPGQNTGLLEPYGDRIRLMYTTGDGLVPFQSQIDFADTVGCERVCMGSGDHGTGDIFSFKDQANWFKTRLGV